MPHPKPIHISSTFFRWHQMDTNHTSCTIKETQEGHMEHWQSTLYSRHCWPWRQVSYKLPPFPRCVSVIFSGLWWSCWMMAHDGRPFEAHQKKKINVAEVEWFFCPKHEDSGSPHLFQQQRSWKNAFGHK